MHYRLKYRNKTTYAFDLAHLQSKAEKMTEHWVITDFKGKLIDEGNKPEKNEDDDHN